MLKQVKSKKLTKKRATKMWSLFARWAYYKAMSEHMPFYSDMRFAEYRLKQFKMEKRMILLMFGVDSLKILAKRWKIIKY